MPTPVNTARQCLTAEAAHALEEAVSVARRRGHGQTTSLHAVSALLSLPSSTLRDACSRARNSAYPPRLQFKALELCLSVSLDRVPTSRVSDDPPVSNSLMAAIKRSQANQRRQPENFHLYHQISQQQSSSSISCIKVELKNLILSILDDPVVSRVFAEAGFRSSEIKLAIVRPLPEVFKFSRFKGLPMFLCNLTEHRGAGAFAGRRGFSFPFTSHTGFSNGDENCRRIGEVLVRNRGRNPLLVGIFAYDTLVNFSELIKERKDNILPTQLSGISVICIEDDVRKFVSENSDKGIVDLRFEEVGKSVEQNFGRGLVVNFGDLKAFFKNDIENIAGNGSSDAATYVVQKLTSLLEIHGGKLWIIGAVASYETYLKFVSRFPAIEKDWDLQLFPITSLRTSAAESFPRSSLMESFVPFGGLFSAPSDFEGPLSSSYQCTQRCHTCNEKCEQEVLAVSKGGSASSVVDQYQSGLPSWLQMGKLGTNKGLDMKTRDAGEVLNTRIAGLQKKWDSICQRLHHSETSGSIIRSSQFSTVFGFQQVEKKEDEKSSNNTDAMLDRNRCMNVNSCITEDLQKISGKQLGVPYLVDSETKTQIISSKEMEKPSKEDHESDGLRSPRSFSNSSMADGSRASPTSVTNVATDLGLRISSRPSSEGRKPLNQNHSELPQDLAGSFSANVDVISGSISDNLPQSSSSSSSDICGQFDPTNFKMLLGALSERVGWQDEATCVIGQTIAWCDTRKEKRHGASMRRDIWFNFLGPDGCGKKKIAAALAEIICGSRENFISADLSAQDGMIDVNGCDVMFRGKTIVDYVAGELCKKPLSVVFLENIDNADVQAQDCLSRAIQTGKFADSHGREVGISNTIFVTTTTIADDKFLSSGKDFSTYSEERILRAKAWPMRMLVEETLGHKMGQDLTLSSTRKKDISSSIFMNKRKLLCTKPSLEQGDFSEKVKRAHKTSTRNLDLNLPAEENDVRDGIDVVSSDKDSMSDNSKSWLQDFFGQVDRNVVFKPYDFDALARRLLNGINESFHKIVGSECFLEIDPKVMEQLLAAAYLSDQKKVVEDWVEQVLTLGFMELLKRYNFSAHSTVKLVACEGLYLEEQIAGVQLPLKIMVD